MKKRLLPILLVLLLASCGGIGYIAGGATTTYKGQYYIELPDSRSDMLDIIAEVAKSIQLNVAQIDESANQIMLSGGTSAASSMMIGKSSFQTVLVSVVDKKLDIKIMVGGNFKEGTKEAADKLFDEFKNKLLVALN